MGDDDVIVMRESAVIGKFDKPVICPKCERGTLGFIPEESDAVISKRGKPPPGKQGDYVQVKCFVCRSLWKLTIE
jgi:phage FluMu protein Com